MKEHYIKKDKEKIWHIVKQSGYIRIIKKDNENEFEIAELSVLPRERRKGIGTDLIKRAEELIKKRGGSEIYMRVEPMELEGWLKKAGYSVIDRYDNYIEMMKLLD